MEVARNFSFKDEHICNVRVQPEQQVEGSEREQPNSINQSASIWELFRPLRRKSLA